MLSDILWSCLILTFCIAGISRPYLALCGVIWIDTLKPQDISFSFLAGKPLSLLITAVFFLSLILNFKTSVKAPKLKTSSFLLFTFMIWITITTYYAEFQSAAWFKYDFSIKTMLFAFFIPFVIHKKNHLHTLIAIFTIATSYYLLIGGWRTLTGGGTYGQNLVETRTNVGITETSTLSMVAVFCIPLIFYLKKYSDFSNQITFFKLLSNILMFSSFLTVFGTYARTGLIGLATLFSFIFKESKRKVLILLAIPLLVLLTIPMLPEDWTERMTTITNAKEEGSALGRIVVWRWTIDYAAENPIFGGGFNSFLANKGVLHLYHEEQETSVDYQENGKAFHNIFFEVLGEHGYVGLFIYLFIIYYSLLLSWKIAKNTENEIWKIQLAKTITICITIYSVCGMFIGVAFFPWIYIFMGLSASLHNIQNDHNKLNSAPAS